MIINILKIFFLTIFFFSFNLIAKDVNFNFTVPQYPNPIEIKVGDITNWTKDFEGGGGRCAITDLRASRTDSVGYSHYSVNLSFSPWCKQKANLHIPFHDDDNNLVGYIEYSSTFNESKNIFYDTVSWVNGTVASKPTILDISCNGGNCNSKPDETGLVNVDAKVGYLDPELPIINFPEELLDVQAHKTEENTSYFAITKEAIYKISDNHQIELFTINEAASLFNSFALNTDDINTPIAYFSFDKNKVGSLDLTTSFNNLENMKSMNTGLEKEFINKLVFVPSFHELFATTNSGVFVWNEEQKAWFKSSQLFIPTTVMPTADLKFLDSIDLEGKNRLHLFAFGSNTFDDKWYGDRSDWDGKWGFEFRTKAEVGPVTTLYPISDYYDSSGEVSTILLVGLQSDGIYSLIYKKDNQGLGELKSVSWKNLTGSSILAHKTIRNLLFEEFFLGGGSYIYASAGNTLYRASLKVEELSEIPPLSIAWVLLRVFPENIVNLHLTKDKIMVVTEHNFYLLPKIVRIN